MVKKYKSVEIFIDELVLHGFSQGERYNISSAIEQELARLINDRGIPASFISGGDVTALNAGSIKMAKGDKAISKGSKIAGSVYTALSGVPFNH